MEFSLTKIETYTGIISACVGGVICGALGGWDVVLKILATMIVLDYVSGLLAAFVEKKLNSEVGFKGVAKKVLIFIVVALAYNIDVVIGASFVRYLVISFYIGIEGLSVLKNAGRAGIPLPGVLFDALDEIRKKSEGKKHDENLS